MLVVKNPLTNIWEVSDVGLTPGSGRSPGGWHGNPLQYSCLENPTDRGAWWATVHRVAKSRTGLKQQPACMQPSVSSVQFSSVQFSHSVVSDSLRPHEWQHTRLPCPSPAPRVHSDSRPSSQWCHPAISTSVVIPFSSLLQPLPALTA